MPTTAPPSKRATASLNDPAATVIHERIAEQVEEIRRCDVAVRADAPEAIHDFRVALRRLRTALITYRAFLDRAITDPIGVELKWLGGMLGAARDAEVQADRLGHLSDEIGTELQRRFRLAYEHAVAALDDERAAGLVTRLTELDSSTPLTPAAESPIQEVLPQHVDRAWSRMGPLVDAAQATEVEAVRADLLHDVRKAAKRARYAAEPLAALGSENARRTVKDAKRIQTVLGEHQDSVAARAMLSELIDADPSRDTVTILVAAHAAEEANAAELEGEFFKLWAGAEFTGRSSADSDDGIA